MIAHSKDLRFLMQGSPGTSRDLRSKYYHGYYCLQMAFDGGIHIQYGPRGKNYRKPVVWTSHPGPLISHGPIDEHGFWTHRYICFTGPLAQTWWTEGLLPRQPLLLDDSEDWARSFDSILNLEDEQTPWAHAYKVNLFEGLLIRLARMSDQSDPEEPWLTRAKALLEDDRNFSPRVSEIAHKCGMAQSTFRRRFNSIMGQSPRNWAMERRLRSARVLLEDRNLSIGEVAHHLGYPDPFSFSKQFKAKEGISPSQWRSAKLNDNHDSKPSI
jgi:AraC-like DNA-binding protein